MDVDSQHDEQKEISQEPKRSRGRPRGQSNATVLKNTRKSNFQSTGSTSQQFNFDPPNDPIALDSTKIQFQHPINIDIQQKPNTRSQTEYPYEIVDTRIEANASEEAHRVFHAHHKMCFKHGGYPKRELVHRKYGEPVDKILFYCTHCKNTKQHDDKTILFTTPAQNVTVIDGKSYNEMELRWTNVTDLCAIKHRKLELCQISMGLKPTTQYVFRIHDEIMGKVIINDVLKDCYARMRNYNSKLKKK
eukprot:499361_1